MAGMVTVCQCSAHLLQFILDSDFSCWLDAAQLTCYTQRALAVQVMRKSFRVNMYFVLNQIVFDIYSINVIKSEKSPG